MLRYLLEKEFKQITRDKFLPKIILLIPVMQLIILPFAANFEMKNLKLGIVDHDHSALSEQLVNKTLSSGYFLLTDYCISYDQGMIAIEKDQADLLMEIPSNFEKKLYREGGADILIITNAVNGAKGGMGSSYLSEIIRRFNIEKGLLPETSTVRITSTNLFNSHLSYKNNMVPGILVFLLTIIAGLLSAMNIVSEKEKGTIEQLNVSPIPKSIFMLSKLIPFWIIGFIILTLGMIISWLIYGLIPVGSFLTIYLFAMVYLVAFTGIGLVVSSVSANQQQAMFTAFFFLIIFALLSGLFTPISSMPQWVQTVTLFNPVRYFVEVMRMIYLKGSTLADLTGYFGIVSLFAVFFNILAVVTYRKKE